MQKRCLNLLHRKDFLAPTPSVHQPIFETSDIGAPERLRPRFSRADLGRMFLLVRRILGKLSANFSANFDGTLLSADFSVLFFQNFSPPPPPQKNSRPELSTFLSNFTFSNPNLFFTPIFCLLGRSGKASGSPD